MASGRVVSLRTEVLKLEPMVLAAEKQMVVCFEERIVAVRGCSVAVC